MMLCSEKPEITDSRLSEAKLIREGDTKTRNDKLLGI